MDEIAALICNGIFSAYLEWGYSCKDIKFRNTSTEIHVEICIIQDRREFHVRRLVSLVGQVGAHPVCGYTDLGRRTAEAMRHQMTVSGLRTPAWGGG